eukprot:403360480
MSKQNPNNLSVNTTTGNAPKPLTHKRHTTGTFRETSLMKQAGMFTFSLDKGAQNYFNNKEMIKNSINQIKQQKHEDVKQNSLSGGSSQLNNQSFYQVPNTSSPNYNNIKSNNSNSDMRKFSTMNMPGDTVRDSITMKQQSIIDWMKGTNTKILLNDNSPKMSEKSMRLYSNVQHQFSEKIQPPGSGTNFINTQKTSIQIDKNKQPNLFVQDKEVAAGGVQRDFSFYNNYAQTPVKTTFSLFSDDPPNQSNTFNYLGKGRVVTNTLDQPANLTIDNSQNEIVKKLNQNSFTLSKQQIVDLKLNLHKHSSKIFGQSPITASKILQSGGASYAMGNSQSQSGSKSIYDLQMKGSNPIVQNQVQQIVNNPENSPMQTSIDSKRQYEMNRSYRQTNIISPVDLFDIKSNQLNPKQSFADHQPSPQNKLHLSIRVKKNNQSDFLSEPTKKRNAKLVEEYYDPITQEPKEKQLSETKGRKRYISQFYEHDKSAHYFKDYKAQVEQFPNLFSKQKSEFTKFQNSIPSSKLILRSSSYGFKQSKF